MLTWEDLKKAELGRTFDVKELQNCCRATYGSIAWPGKKPGFAVVLAMSRRKENDSDSHEICLLDECEHSDLRELIVQCRRLDAKWEPELWFGDTNNDAAEEFIYEMNANANAQWFDPAARKFNLVPTCLLYPEPMQEMYSYILGTLKGLLGERQRRLFLKDGIIKNYLDQIKPDEVAELKRGDYPAIEALGYAVVEMLHLVKHAGHLPSHTGDDSMYPDEGEFDHLLRPGATAVSYTHLTLPTILLV